jgi:poly(3-hydroxybutyrate) depolymerase
VLAIGSIASDLGTAVGVVAGMIAVGGFIAHAPKVLARAPEKDVQVATVLGGLVGCWLGAFVVVLSAIASTLSL